MPGEFLGDTYKMDWLNDKMWTLAAAIVSAFSGYVLTQKRKADKRFDGIEETTQIHKTEIAVMKSQYTHIEEDINQIKDMITLLLRKTNGL